MSNTANHINSAARWLALVFLLVAGLRPTAAASDQVLNGDPLRITCSDTLSMTVFRNEIPVSSTSGTAPAYERQYFSTYDTFIRRTDSNQATTVTGGFSATPVSNTSTNVGGIGTTGTISTTVSTTDGLSITQVVTYVNGQDLYQHTWTVTNTSQTDFTNVCLRYGGDSFFLNSDAANGFFDSGLGMVFCTNPGASGLMGIFGGAQTPASHHYEDGFRANGSALQAAADLPDTVNPAFIDNGMSLQWDQGNLAHGQTFTIVAFEKWTAAGLIQVLAPAQITSTVGSNLTLTFSVRNLQTIADSATLVVSGSAGLTVSAPASVQLAANGAANVDVAVTVGAGAQDTLATVTLTATATSNGNLVNGDIARISVGTPNPNPPPPTVALVSIPPIAVSTGATVHYAAICLSTPEGVSRALSIFGAVSSTQAVAFAWDATIQDYVKLPAAPSGGLLPTSGIFVATRRDLGLDFNGTPSSLPLVLTLQPGFNFVGIPPLDSGNGFLTAHAFPRDFELLDETSTLVTTTTRFADILGTVGSNNPATAAPYLFNGTGYTQQGTLFTGVGYFIKNNATLPVTLRRVLSGTVLTNPSVASAISPTLANAAQTRVVAPTHTYTDRGAPPAPPSGSSSAPAASGGGHACGLGSGVVGLVGFLLLGWRRRLRSDAA